MHVPSIVTPKRHRVRRRLQVETANVPIEPTRMSLPIKHTHRGVVELSRCRDSSSPANRRISCKGSSVIADRATQRHKKRTPVEPASFFFLIELIFDWLQATGHRWSSYRCDAGTELPMRRGRCYANRALRALLAEGHTVVPVHPRVREIEGIAVLPDLTAIEDQVDTVTVYVNPAISAPIHAK